MRGLEALSAARVWRSFCHHRRECMLSAGGTGTGSFWQAVPKCPSHFFNSAHWRAAFRQRLGILCAPPSLTCQLRGAGASSRTEDDSCGQALDPQLRHPLLCKVGPARMRPHKAMAAVVAVSLRSSGAKVDLERVWPSLYRWEHNVCIKAIMDVVAWWPGSCQSRLINVTVRCPHADRYHRTAERAGVPADAGEREKRRRYGAAVAAIALESYGRMGVASQAALESLAAEAAVHGQGSSLRLLPAWRLAIERAVLWAQADVILLALGANFDAGGDARLGRQMPASG